MKLPFNKLHTIKLTDSELIFLIEFCKDYRVVVGSTNASEDIVAQAKTADSILQKLEKAGV